MWLYKGESSCKTSVNVCESTLKDAKVILNANETCCICNTPTFSFPLGLSSGSPKADSRMRAGLQAGYLGGCLGNQGSDDRVSVCREEWQSMELC